MFIHLFISPHTRGGSGRLSCSNRDFKDPPRCPFLERHCVYQTKQYCCNVFPHNVSPFAHASTICCGQTKLRAKLKQIETIETKHSETFFVSEAKLPPQQMLRARNGEKQ